MPVFLVLYHLFCATDLVTDSYTRSWIGVSMITITSISLGINLFGLFITNLKNVASFVRRNWAKYRLGQMVIKVKKRKNKER